MIFNIFLIKIWYGVKTYVIMRVFQIFQLSHNDLMKLSHNNEKLYHYNISICRIFLKMILVVV